MTDAERRFMKAQDRIQNTFIGPLDDLLQATRELVREHKAEADKNQKLHTTIEVLRNMNEDGQFGARVALEQLWEMLYATNQTQACENLRSLIAAATKAETTEQRLARERDPRHGNY